MAANNSGNKPKSNRTSKSRPPRRNTSNRGKHAPQQGKLRRSNRRDSGKNGPSQPTERLQKYIARAGLTSRRDAETWITQGRVQVNGKIVTELGTKVDPQRDRVMVDGETVRPENQRQVYIMLNKPRYVLSSTKSEHGRKTTVDIVQVPERLFPVGRLDFVSEGLMLLTNDGDLAQKLTHPSYAHEREYMVLLTRELSRDEARRWRAGGFEVDGRAVGPMQISPYGSQGPGWYRVILTEGRKRQIRTVAEQLGLSVNTLIRTRFGPLKLGNLKPGAWRHLTSREVESLKRTVSRRSHPAHPN